MRSNVLVALILAVLLAPGLALATWQTAGSSLPAPGGTTSAAFYLDGKIYVFGGAVEWGTWTNHGEVRIYDVLNDTWSEGTDAPKGMYRAAAATDGTKVYFMSFRDEALNMNTDIYIYDIAGDTWSTGTTIGTMESQSALYDPDTEKVYMIAGPASEPTTYIYNPSSDFYYFGEPMPNSGTYKCVALIDGDIVAAGGMPSTGLPPVATLPLSYDIAGDTWSELGPIDPSPTWDHGCGVIDDKIYVVGGRTTDWNVFTDVVQSYDSAKGSWTNIEVLPKLLGGAWAAAAGGYLFVGGGKNTDGMSFVVYYQKFHNTPPEITSTPVTSIVLGETYEYDVEAIDQDILDDLTFELTVAPSAMSIDAASGLIAWDMSGVEPGDYDVTVEADDGEDAGEQSFVVTVTAAADDDDDDDATDDDDDSADDDNDDDDDDDSGCCG